MSRQLKSYLRLVRRMPASEADDLLQAFIADRLLEHDLLERADESRGRFRALLLTSLNNFAAGRRRAQMRRLVVSLEEEELAAAGGGGAGPETAATAAWARALVHNVIQAMHEQCEETGRRDVWHVFEARVLREIFQDTPPVAYEDLARALNLNSPAQAANLLVTAKRMYARILRAAIAEYEKSDEGIDAELAELRECLTVPPPADGD